MLKVRCSLKTPGSSKLSYFSNRFPYQVTHEKMNTYRTQLLCFTAAITVLTSLPVIAQEKGFSIEKLNNLESLRLEEIGKLRLIVEFRVLTFPFNMSDIAEEVENTFDERLNKIKRLHGSIVSGSNLIFNFKNAIYELEVRIKRMKRNMLSMNTGNVQSLPKRQKRFFSFMTNYDEGLQISEDLKNLFETVTQLKSATVTNREMINNITRTVIGAFSEQASQTMILQNQTIALGLNTLIVELQSDITQYEDKQRSIRWMMLHQKLDSSIVSVDEMDKQLKIIGRSLKGTDKELPFNNIHEYFSKVAVSFEISNGSFTFRMRIPIVESDHRTLYQIEKVPTRVDNKLIILDTQWSYLANTSDQVVKFASLHLCFKTEHAQQSVHLCEIQSPIHSTRDSKDCLTKSFTEEKIDLGTCGPFIRGVQFSNLTFIKQSEGRFFYFTQRNEILQIFCNGKENNVTLEPKMGMVRLSTGCIARTNHERLLVTDEVVAEPVWSSVLNVPLDRTQLGSLDEMNFGGLSVSYLYKSIDELNKIASSSGESPEIKIPDRNYRNDIIDLTKMLLFPGIMLIIFFVYLKCRRPQYAAVRTEK